MILHLIYFNIYNIFQKKIFSGDIINSTIQDFNY